MKKKKYGDVWLFHTEDEHMKANEWIKCRVFLEHY